MDLIDRESRSSGHGSSGNSSLGNPCFSHPCFGDALGWQVKLAVQEFEKALKLDPDSSKARDPPP
eukprot:6894305-Prymnesium_polylepis.1